MLALEWIFLQYSDWVIMGFGIHTLDISKFDKLKKCR